MSHEECEEYYYLESELDCLEYFCMECDERTIITEEMITNLINYSGNHIYKVVKERNKEYDDK